MTAFPSAGHGLRLSDVTVGTNLPELRREPTRLQLFRFSAVTWNGHRIHFDPDYAKQEGYPDVLVQSNLHTAFLTTLVTEWIGITGKLTRLEASVRRYAIPGDLLICRGVVTALDSGRDTFGLAHLDLTETRQSDGTECARGSATVALPL